MGSSAGVLARSLACTQRKPLRRRGRGGSLTRTMSADPLIVRLSDYSRLEPPVSADALAASTLHSTPRGWNAVRRSSGHPQKFSQWVFLLFWT